MVGLYRAYYAIVGPVLVALSMGAHAHCDDIVPTGMKTAVADRAIMARDLIELRDVGNPDASDFSGPSPFAMSPDGRRIAYVLSRADLADNGYCRALVISSLDDDKGPIVLDRGGELILADAVQRGFYAPTGVTTTIVPIWSPDGRQLTYLRRDNGLTRAWIAKSDGSGAHAVSHLTVDVEAVGWSTDGQRLLFSSRSNAMTAALAIDREAQTGWLYDERIGPQNATRPMVRASADRDVHAVARSGGPAVAASDEDRKAFQRAVALQTASEPVAVAGDGRRAGIERQAPSPVSPATLYATGRDGQRLSCTAANCKDGIIGLWWDENDQQIVYMRREGWAKGEIGLYRWVPGAALPTAVLQTSDLLNGCTQAHDQLVCTRENATTPRRIVALDTTTGKIREIFDPNPEFSGIRLGHVERLKWQNDIGLKAWGDLVLPPGTRPGKPLPMVVVQYHSDGFLRGGTGDEYPIFLLAAHGFAVLSTERPAFFSSQFPQLRDWTDLIAVEQKDWAERRSLLSSVLTGVQMVVTRGVADAGHIGITGLSDGGATVAFALINSTAFAAAATSSCCMEPRTTMTYGGIAWANFLQKVGYPPATKDDRAFWRDMSLTQNANKIDTPLLMQLSDNEYLLALEAFSALHEQRKPVEMYIFPNEFHLKWQPVHRAAIYERTIDWFSFWLQGEEDPDPAKADQYQRWRAMKARSADGQPAAATP